MFGGPDVAALRALACAAPGSKVSPEACLANATGSFDTRASLGCAPAGAGRGDTIPIVTVCADGLFTTGIAAVVVPMLPAFPGLAAPDPAGVVFAAPGGAAGAVVVPMLPAGVVFAAPGGTAGVGTVAASPRIFAV